MKLLDLSITWQEKLRTGQHDRDASSKIQTVGNYRKDDPIPSSNKLQGNNKRGKLKIDKM